MFDKRLIKKACFKNEMDYSNRKAYFELLSLEKSIVILTGTGKMNIKVLGVFVCLFFLLFN